MFIADFAGENRIAFLNMGGIQQHDLYQVGGGRRTMNIAFKSFFNQVRHIADVVDMRMG